MAYTKEEAKEIIKSLIIKFNEHISKWKKISENETKTKFLDPLFTALGWDVEGKKYPDEVIKEERIQSKRADYTFRIDGIPKLIVEAKAIKEDLEKRDYAEQAKRYAYNKRVSWAVLTDFEGLKIFYANDDSLSPFRDIILKNLDRLDENFEILWLLSKGLILDGKIDNKAETEGRKPKKIPIDEKLFIDLNKWREKLSRDISKTYKGKYQDYEVDEIVQRIIDRLIFIKKTEDLGIEESYLGQIMVQSHKNSYNLLKEIFIKFEQDYDSKLFDEKGHECDKIGISNETILYVINGLYGQKDRTVEYDFSSIDADILGSIYEQYLGHILKKTKITAKVLEKYAHRKKQGIYYTPTYIVDFIVRNILRNYKDTNNLKIIDFACGSGSFLLKSFDYLVSKSVKDGDSQTKLDIEGVTFSKKVQILKKCIYGIDLDEKAVEIAQLNLLLKIMEKRQRLPVLRENIKIGNSVIDNPNYTNKPFEWNNEPSFNSNFDVVIGNPPYVQMQKMPSKEREFFEKYRKEEYASQNDLWYYFLIKGINILKDGGYLGYITSRYFLEATHAKKLRKFILNNCQIKYIVDFGKVNIFEGIGTHTSIIILQKSKEKRNNNFKVVKVKDWDKDNSSLIQHINKHIDNSEYEDGYINIFNYSQKDLDESSWEIVSKSGMKLINKMRENSHQLIDICKLGTGVKTGHDKAFVITDEEIKKKKLERNPLKNWIKNSDIFEWGIRHTNKFVIYANKNFNLEDYPNIKQHLSFFSQVLKNKYKSRGEDKNWFELYRPREYLFEKPKEKLVCPYKAPKNRFAYDTTIYCGSGDIYAIILKKDTALNLKYILGILNSNLLNYYYRKVGKKKGGVYEYYTEPLSKMPIHKIQTKEDKNIEQEIIRLVDELIKVKQRLINLRDKRTDENITLKEKINDLEKKLNNLVYKLYGLTNKEKEVIENSL